MSNLSVFPSLERDQDGDSGSDIGVLLLSDGEEVTTEEESSGRVQGARMADSQTANLIDYVEEFEKVEESRPVQRKRESRRSSNAAAVPRPKSGSRRSMNSAVGMEGERSSGYLKAFLAVLVLALVLFVVGEYHYLYHVQPDTCRITSEEQVARWNSLQTAAKEELFGQHIAIEGTLRAIYAHITDPSPKKALVLCFHGWLGSGKTFLSHLVANHLFDGGLKSPYVKSFIGPRHFLLDPSKLHENQEMLVNTIEATVKGCPRSIFIFDEVDKMPSAIFNVLVPFIGHHGLIDGIDYGKATFIFLSNTGGERINNLTLAYLKSGKQRTELSLYDFRQIVADGAFNEDVGESYFTPPQAVLEYFNSLSVFINDLHSTPTAEYLKAAVVASPMWKALKKSISGFAVAERDVSSEGGLFQSEMITRRLVDHYIPFLPLEKKHVIQCAKREMKRRNVLYIDPIKIANRVVFFPKEHEVFAEDGCKNIMAHVAYYVHDSEDIFQDPL